ncbi:MAG: potassium transporter [Anaerolineae bacterium]|nr:potassium transporter [Anaerolineae bacterium]
MRQAGPRVSSNKTERSPRARTYFRVPVYVRIIGGLLMLIVIGTLLLMLPAAGAKGPLTFQQALFTSVSALCVTGLSIITPSADLTWFGQLVLLFEIQVGGVGFMFMVVLTLRLLRRRVGLVDRLAIRDSLGLPEHVAYAPILRRTLIAIAIIEGVGTLLLWLNWRHNLEGLPALWYALFHSVSAFCNAGFDLFTGLPQYPTGLPHDLGTLAIMGIIIMLGGLGFPVMAEMAHWRPHKRLTLHSRLGIGIALVLVLVGASGLLISERGLLAQIENPAQRVVYALFQSISTRSAGFALGDLDQLTPASQFLIIVLMFIGSGAASMGGGITTGTLLVLLISLLSYARGYPEPRVEGRTLPAELPRRAAAVLTVAAASVIVATWLLLITENGTLDQALFEVVSAFSTTGLALSFTTELNPVGLVIIMGMMIWGRLGALTIVFALARTQPAPPIRYPEESLLIG